MKRRKGLACSSPLCPDSQLRQKLEGDIYNIFPYIEDPKHIDEGKARAFTLTGLIDAVFLPIIHTGELDRIPGTASHELAHFMLGSAMVACEERVLVTYLLGEVWQFLFDADGDVHLLIPSFTIVGPAGKDFELARRAEQLCRLLQAREPVHEIVARAIQVGSQGWDRSKARQLIRQEVGNDLLDRKTLESFLHVYEYLEYLDMEPIGACLLGQYALNEVGLTQQSSLARFKYATEVASTFKSKDHQSTSPRARLARYLSFVQHLDSNLPDFNMTRCPLAGACAPTRIERGVEAWVDLYTNRSGEDGNPEPSLAERAVATVYLNSTLCMRKSRCDREERFAQGNEVLPNSVQELLGWYDPEVLSVLGYEGHDPTGRGLRSLTLIEHDNCDYKYTVGTTPKEKDIPLVELQPGKFAIFLLEASLQQMMYGEGPLCLCYPHQPVNCTYRPLLQRMWDYTEPDPEWENNWKQPKNKPRCIE